MDLIEQLNRAIDYIEMNLTDAEALSSVAHVTSYSTYHFQRIFNYLTDMPLSEYIRKRKLSVAVVDLQRGEKVIDVAIKYGYNSADSFTRAFERQHGSTPTIARQDGVKFQIYPPLTVMMMVPAMTWAIFSVDDCEMQPMWRRIYAEWLPTSGYNPVGDITFEMYYGKADNPRGEIWIPVEPQ